MDRTVPTSGNEEINLYLRTYYSLLRSTRAVQIKTLIEAHKRMKSALHIHANAEKLDMSAFIYAILRMPTVLNAVNLVLMGQSEQVFAQHGFPDIESWQVVSAPGRRRRSFFDGKGILAVYIASRSDIDDIVPILVAYLIERRKLRQRLSHHHIIDFLTQVQAEDGRLDSNGFAELAQMSGITVEELLKLHQIWSGEMVNRLLDIATRRQEIAIRSLAGSLADYKRATRRWWQNVERKMPKISFADRPVYFVSSNTHSMANLLSGFALHNEAEIHAFIDADGSESLHQEYHDIRAESVPSSLENFLYYALKKWEQGDKGVKKRRQAAEKKVGLKRIPSKHAFDIEVQVTALSKLKPACWIIVCKCPGWKICATATR
jgi:hypothetical protein